LIKPFDGTITESDVLNEFDAVQKLCQENHPNIVQVLAHGRLNPNLNSIYFIDMELCDLTLDDYAKGKILVPTLPNWKTAKENNTVLRLIVPIICQIIDGVVFIHNHDEVHRDLKPSNSNVFQSMPAKLDQFCIR